MRRLVPTRGRVMEIWHNNLRRTPWIFRDRFGFNYLFRPGDNFAWYYDHNVVLDDPSQLRFLERTIQPGMVVLDVGANIGGMSILTSKLLDKRGQLFAFEANPATYRTLQVNFLLNELPAEFETHNLAVTNEDGVATLNLFPQRASSWNTLGNFELGGLKPERSVSVASIRLDTFAKQKQLRRIDLLKVDVEGAEPEVFQGARELFRSQSIGQVMFEISKPPLIGMGHSVNDVLKPLLEAHYQLLAILPSGQTRPTTAAEIEGTTFGNFIATARRDS